MKYHKRRVGQNLPESMRNAINGEHDPEQCELLQEVMLFRRETGRIPSVCDYLLIFKELGYKKG